MCFVYSVCFSFFSIYLLFFLFFLCRSLDSRIPITSQNANKKNRKIQNPNSKIQIKKRRSVSPLRMCLPNTCVCPPVCPTASSPKAQTFEPPLTIHFDEKIGLFAPYFFMFVIKAAAVFFCAVHWISHHIPKCPPKKIARVPPRGPFPLW